MLIYFQSNPPSSLKESTAEEKQTGKEGISTKEEEEDQPKNVDTARNPDDKVTLTKAMEPRDENIEDDNNPGDKNSESPVEGDKKANCNNAEIALLDNGNEKNCPNRSVNDDGIKKVINVGFDLTPEESIVSSESKPNDNLPQESAADINQNECDSDEKVRSDETTTGQCSFSHPR